MKVYRIHTNKRVIVVHTDERAILDPRLERSKHQLPALVPAKWHSPRSGRSPAVVGVGPNSIPKDNITAKQVAAVLGGCEGQGLYNVVIIHGAQRGVVAKIAP